MKRSDQKSTRFPSILFFGTLAFGTFVVAVVALEVFLESRKPLEFPFHNILYPYVEFRPPSNITWHSERPSPSSRTGEFAVEYTNRDSLRIPYPDYRLDREKPAGQIRIAMIGGSTVRIGTRFEVSLPGALKRTLQARYPGTNIDVLNGGIISAISRQELIFLMTTLIDYNIDMLITYDGINDSGQMLYYERRPNFPYNYRVMEEAWTQYVTGRKAPWWRQLLNRSTILESLWPEKFGAANMLDRVAGAELIEDAALRQVYADAYGDNWDKIRRVCTAYNIRPFFVLQPTSLCALFQNGSQKANSLTRMGTTLYANYLIYEALRNTTRTFSETHPEISVLDLTCFLPAEAFFDGAHVYDDVNDRIAERLVDFIANDIEHMVRQSKHQ